MYDISISYCDNLLISYFFIAQSVVICQTYSITLYCMLILHLFAIASLHVIKFSCDILMLRYLLIDTELFDTKSMILA